MSKWLGQVLCRSPSSTATVTLKLQQIMPAVQTMFADTFLAGKKIMAVNISKLYPNRHDPDGRGSTYECARKYWRASKKRAESMNYVLAVSDGVIVAVYRPVRWMESKVMPGRLEFEGEKVREGDLVGMDVSSMFAGRSNPVKYIE